MKINTKFTKIVNASLVLLISATHIAISAESKEVPIARNLYPKVKETRASPNKPPYQPLKTQPRRQGNYITPDWATETPDQSEEEQPQSSFQNNPISPYQPLKTQPLKTQPLKTQPGRQGNYITPDWATEEGQHQSSNNPISSYQPRKMLQSERKMGNVTPSWPTETAQNEEGQSILIQWEVSRVR